MASLIFNLSAINLFFLCIIVNSYGANGSQPTCGPMFPPHGNPVAKIDRDLLQFALNLEFLEAEFFSWSAFGYGLDKIAPEEAMHGPPPIGGQKANLDILTYNIISNFALQEVGHIRAIETTVGGFPRPLLDLSAKNFAKFFDQAVGYPLDPPFDPYRDSLSYMLACYVIPYVGMNGYVGANPMLIGYKAKMLLAGLLGVEAGQDGVIRTYLFERGHLKLHPYGITVAEMTDKISELRNKLGMCGIKDEGLIVPKWLGAENRTNSNILSADPNSLSYARTPPEILKIVYDSGNEHIPGGFYPEGANGKIARQFLHKP